MLMKIDVQVCPICRKYSFVMHSRGKAVLHIYRCLEENNLLQELPGSNTNE